MRTIVKNKNGILMPETLKIILAVIGISILAYLVFSFTGIFMKNTKLKQAEASLNLIKEKINFIEKDGENINVLLTSPKDWMVVSFPDEEEKVLCICPEKNENKENYVLCKEEGVCDNFPLPINLITLALDNYVSLKEVPREIFIQKEEKKFKIYTEKKQVEHEIIFNNFLNTEIEVDREKKKIFEQMIEIVESTSTKGIEDINPPIIYDFNKLFGESGWAMRYSKEGASYPWNYVDGNSLRDIWEIASFGIGENVAIVLEEKIIYEKGVLKVQFRALKG